MKSAITICWFYGKGQAVMKPDRHAVDGKYEIRSLYFDNLDDEALREN